MSAFLQGMNYRNDFFIKYIVIQLGSRQFLRLMPDWIDFSILKFLP